LAHCCGGIHQGRGGGTEQLTSLWLESRERDRKNQGQDIPRTPQWPTSSMWVLPPKVSITFQNSTTAGDQAFKPWVSIMHLLHPDQPQISPWLQLHTSDQPPIKTHKIKLCWDGFLASEQFPGNKYMNSKKKIIIIFEVE
jgi:hypothetical protein